MKTETTRRIFPPVYPPLGFHARCVGHPTDRAALNCAHEQLAKHEGVRRALEADAQEFEAATLTLRHHMAALRTEMGMMRDLLSRKQDEIARLRADNTTAWARVREAEKKPEPKRSSRYRVFDVRLNHTHAGEPAWTRWAVLDDEGCGLSVARCASEGEAAAVADALNRRPAPTKPEPAKFEDPFPASNCEGAR